MTPKQKLRKEILEIYKESEDLDPPWNYGEITEENVDSLYHELDGNSDFIQEIRNDLRTWGTETNISCEYSRHYDSNAVAYQLKDGNWIGWTFWYGGGKWGEPDAIPWMEHAYDLEIISEKEVVAVVREFKKKDVKPEEV